MKITHQSQLIDHFLMFSDTEEYIKAWFHSIKAREWSSLKEVIEAFPRAQILDDETISFTIVENSCYIIASFMLPAKVLSVRTIRSHKPVDLNYALERFKPSCH